MKRFIAVMGIVVFAGLILFAAPKHKRRVKNQQVRTTNKNVATPKKKTQPKEIIVEFRLEYQQASGRGCKNSAVLSAKQGEYGGYNPKQPNATF